MSKNKNGEPQLFQKDKHTSHAECDLDHDDSGPWPVVSGQWTVDSEQRTVMSDGRQARHAFLFVVVNPKRKRPAFGRAFFDC